KRGPAAPPADQARSAAALGRRRRAGGTRPRRALSRRADRGAADRAKTPVAADHVVRRRGRAAESWTAAACVDARGPCRRFSGRRDQAAQALHRSCLSRAIRARAYGPDLRRSGDRRAQAAHRRQSALSLGGLPSRPRGPRPPRAAPPPGMTFRHAVDSLEALAKGVLPAVRAALS